MNADVWQYILNIFFSEYYNYALSFRQQIDKAKGFKSSLYREKYIASPYSCRLVCKIWNDMY